MTWIPRQMGWSGASALLVCVAGVLGAAGATAGACALPGYTLGDVTTGAGGAGGGKTSGGVGGDMTVGSGGAGVGGTNEGGDGSGGMAGKSCGTVKDCQPSGSACIKVACPTGTCEYITAPDGPYPFNDAAVDIPKNCNVAVCSKGVLHYEPDPKDLPDDGNDCTYDGCLQNGHIKHVSDPNVTSCSLDANQTMGICDGENFCVECTDMTCATCKLGHCVEGDTCANLTKDGDETGEDCGGSCAPCPKGEGCNEARDCIDGVCSNHVCDASCIDMVRNQGEIDVDCGGPCGPCRPGQRCTMSDDCKGKVCENGYCQFTCADGVQNGDEAGVDCGGTLCSFVKCN